MSRLNLNTWTICAIYIIILPQLCFSAPAGGTANLTLWQAVVGKCPSLSNVTLPSDLKELVNTKCVNWTAINSAVSLTENEKNNVQCLVFYESLISFCTTLEDQAGKMLEFITTEASKTNLTEQMICTNNSSLYVLKGIEHNISAILQPENKPYNCIWLCTEMHGKLVVADTCKYSYYFATFDASKYMSHLKEIPSKPLINAKPEVPVEPPHNANASVKQAHEEYAAVQKSKATVNEDLKHDELKPEVKSKVGDDNLQAGDSNSKVENSIPEPKLPLSPVNGQEEKGSPPKSDGENDVVSAQESEKDKKPSDDLNKDKEIADAVGPNQEGEQKIAPANPNEDQGDINEDKGAGPDEGGFGQDDEDIGPEDVDVNKAIFPNIEQKSPPKQEKPNTVEDEPVSKLMNPEDDMDGESYFFSYFTVLMCLFIIAYVGYHNRQKILALLLEGKRGRRCARQGRRPDSANYHKLDSNLEEAISSNCTKNASNVIY